MTDRQAARHRGRPAPVRRGRGPAGLLALVGGLLVLAAVVVHVDHGGGHVLDRDVGQLRMHAAGDARGPLRRPRTEVRHEGRVTAGHPSTAAPAHRSGPRASPPLGLTIPALAVSAPVVPVALQGTTLVPPSDPHVLGWWSGGAPAGARRGTTVITGHTVHTGGGTFDDLGRLARGDLLDVRTATGVVTYRVYAVSDHSKDWLAAHAQQVFSPTVAGRLAMVTCTDWTGTEYLSNTVVLATPVGH